jgi:hypothetical protein
MRACGFAYLEPFPSQLVGRTLALGLDDRRRKGALQSQCTPRPVCRNMFGLELQQEQIGHDRDSHRAFHLLDLGGDLLWPESHNAFEFRTLAAPPTTGGDRSTLAGVWSPSPADWSRGSWCVSAHRCADMC